MKHDVYLAGPFFSDEQKRTMGRARLYLECRGWSVCDPQDLSPVIVDLPEEERGPALFDEIFRRNIEGVRDARAVFACVDWKDTGTSFEIGLAYGLGVPFYTFSLRGASCNVMLARGAHGHISNMMSDSCRFEIGDTFSTSEADE